eukprot:584308-Rhodomonas_salina.1
MRGCSTLVLTPCTPRRCAALRSVQPCTAGTERCTAPRRCDGTSCSPSPSSSSSSSSPTSASHGGSSATTLRAPQVAKAKAFPTIPVPFAPRVRPSAFDFAARCRSMRRPALTQRVLWCQARQDSQVRRHIALPSVRHIVLRACYAESGTDLLRPVLTYCALLLPGQRMPLEGDIYANDPLPVHDPSLLHANGHDSSHDASLGSSPLEEPRQDSDAAWVQPPREHDPKAVLYF